MFAIGYHNRPTLPTNNSRAPVNKKILSISWKIDHFQTRTGVIQSVLFSTNSLSCSPSPSANSSSSTPTDLSGSGGAATLSSNPASGSSSDNQPSEIWCLELDTNRSPLNDRSGGPSLQQEPDQQVPVCNMIGHSGSLADHRRFGVGTVTTSTTTTSSSNPNRSHSPNRGHVQQQPSNDTSSGTSRVGSPESEQRSGGGYGAGGGSSNSSALQHSPAPDSTSSNYMSLYLRLVYWKQEFNYVHLKAGVFTDRMDITVLGEKDFHTDEPIGWAHFLNKESVVKFILGQDKQDDKQGYIQLYLELILNETKRKEGVECKAFAHSDLILDFSTLLQQKSLSDITLICGERVLHVHKAVLAARSPIFRAMFMHPSQENQTNQIELKDVEFEIVEELINFIYTGQVARLDQLADSLLPVADKYAIVSLVKLCEESLSFNLNVDNVVHRLVLSYLHNAVTLKRAALGFIERNICTVRLTEGWMQAQMKYPQLFLECFPYTEQLSLIVSKSMMSF